MQRARKPENVKQELLNRKLFKDSWVEELKQHAEIIKKKMESVKPKNIMLEKVDKRKKTEVSRKWFDEKIKNYFAGKDDPEIYGKQNYNGISVRSFSTIFVGKLIYFHYLAKYRNILNYWDKYPLALIYKQDRTHLYGLNFHYVPPDIRFTILESLVNSVQFLPNDRAYFKLTYQKMSQLSTIKFIKPCVKTYIFKNMTPPRVVKPQYWFNAIYLPNAQWVIRNYG